MNGSYEGGEVVIRMSPMEANSLKQELFYTIDYMPEEHEDYVHLWDALSAGLVGKGERA